MKSNTEIINHLESLLDAMITNNLAERNSAHQEALQLSRELLGRATNACSEQYCLEYDLHINRLAVVGFDVDRNHTELLGASQVLDKLRSGHGFNIE